MDRKQAVQDSESQISDQVEEPTSSTSSINSYFSARTTFTVDLLAHDGYRPESVDPQSASIYSYRPSTVSTDYGLYYTRRALSQEEFSNDEWDINDTFTERPDDSTTISAAMSSMSIASGSDASTGMSTMPLQPYLSQSTNADSKPPPNRDLLDKIVEDMFKYIKARPAHRFICESTCQVDKRRVRWVITLSSGNSRWEGKGNSEAKAQQDAAGKALNKLASRPGYGPARQFDSGPETHQCYVLLISFCRLLGREDPQYKYTSMGSRSKVWRTRKWTCIVSIDGQPYAWARGYEKDWSRERAAAYALADLNDKYPGHLP